MRLIDADSLAYEFKSIGRSYNELDYEQGWNDAIDAIVANAPTVLLKGGYDTFTADKFKKYMKEYFDKAQDNPEVAHRLFDMTMCEALDRLGYGKGLEYFYDAPKGYNVFRFPEEG